MKTAKPAIVTIKPADERKRNSAGGRPFLRAGNHAMLVARRPRTSVWGKKKITQKTKTASRKKSDRAISIEVRMKSIYMGYRGDFARSLRAVIDAPFARGPRAPRAGGGETIADVEPHRFSCILNRRQPHLCCKGCRSCLIAAFLVLSVNLLRFLLAGTPENTLK